MRVYLAHMMQQQTSTPYDKTLNIESCLHTLAPQHGHVRQQNIA